MKISRKDFLKLSALAFGALATAGVSFLNGCKSIPGKLKGARSIPGICPFCSMGCGITISVRQDKIINIEGDPDHPVNEGKLCAKGNAVFQLSIHNRKRIDRIKYRAPFASEWAEITWQEALNKISNNIKNTRDKTFIENAGKSTANLTTGIAVVGGSLLTNEESYLLSKMARLLGITQIWSESAFYNSPADPGLVSTLGYGAMTNNWTDVKNSDVIIIIGSNPAENHPVSVRHILKAKKAGGKIIHIDPRFTRTSVIADYYVPIRPGTDIAFIGGIINYALRNNRIQKTYLAEYTDAPFLVNNIHELQYSNPQSTSSTWDYERDKKGIPKTDKSFVNPDTVFQIIKKHFSKYSVEAVSSTTGCPAKKFLEIADIISSSYIPERTACIIYSSGITQHTVGSQNVRALAILQLLLGNIGTSGGGLNRLRSGFNEQGCADNGLNADYLPGYLPAPDVTEHPDLASYIKNTVPVTNDQMSINIPGNRNAHMVSMLKAYYGQTALKNTFFCYNWLPKIHRTYEPYDFYNGVKKDIIKGALIAGANPVLLSPDLNKQISSLENLDWMVVTDFYESETSLFWKKEDADPGKIKTEVFLLPSAVSFEKEGSVTNSGRWVQWMNKATDPPGEAKAELWIFDKIFKTVRSLHKNYQNAFFPEPITESNWNYSGSTGQIDPRLVSKEINGFKWKSGKPLTDEENLRDDGSTAAGNWLYCGSINGTKNLMERRIKKDSSGEHGLFPGWAWSWPGNTRILYNRAGVSRNGTSWNTGKQVIKWDEEWEGDPVNGGKYSGPGEKNPFIMLPEGVARLLVKELADGPLPEHYEPLESPFNNQIMVTGNSYYKNNPALKTLGNSKEYPFIATIYKISDNWLPGAASMTLPWLAELVPDMICEISSSLADLKNLKQGDKVRISSKRGILVARCLVTERIRPFMTGGKEIEMIGIVMNSGHEKAGNTFNRLIHELGDPNSSVHEYKAFLADIIKEV